MPDLQLKPRDRYIVTCDGLSLHFAEWGDSNDQTTILIHGMKDQCRSWDFVLNAAVNQGLATGHIVAPDLRGHGDSDWSRRSRDYAIENFIADLAALVTYLKKPTVRLVGHSFGGHVALLYCGAFPASVESLALIESVGPRGKDDDIIPTLIAERITTVNRHPITVSFSTLHAAATALKEALAVLPWEVCLHMARYGTRVSENKFIWKYDPRVSLSAASMYSEQQIEAFIRRIGCDVSIMYRKESAFVDPVRERRIKLFKSGKPEPFFDATHHIPHDMPYGLARTLFTSKQVGIGRTSTIEDELSEDLLSSEQRAKWNRCIHPKESIQDFHKEDIDGSIVDRFEYIVDNHADQTAMIENDGQVRTYRWLNENANRLARAIVELRGSESEGIGLLIEMSGQLVIGMLAALKSGKYFILLDPRFPRYRLETIIRDSQLSLIVASNEYLTEANSLAGTRCAVVEFGSIGDEMPCENVHLAVPNTTIAFILYTSGSTGEPKGVIQNHRNLLHRAMVRTNLYHLCSFDKVAVLSAGTSNTITYTFTALLAGAVLIPYAVHKKGIHEFSTWLKRQGITICPISAPLYRAMLESFDGSIDAPDLRLVQLTSEKVQKSDIDLFKLRFPSNCYLAVGLSSTEAGLISIVIIDHNTELPGDDVPVGLPAEGKAVMLVDDSGREVEVGAVGEITVCSEFLAEGYWNRPDLTARHFSDSGEDSKTRTYRTGDLGMVTRSGCLYYIGRKDFRVKVRGYGVDLTEIEQALLRHHLIKDVAVVAVQQGGEENRLTAFFTTRTDAILKVEELRLRLRNTLPSYMMPHQFVQLEEMPLTPNGKINRLELGGKHDTDTPATKTNIRFRDAIEMTLAMVWSDILGRRDFGVEEGFLELGGDSLQATRIVSRVVKEFGMEFPVACLLENTSVAKMATVIRSQLEDMHTG